VVWAEVKGCKEGVDYINQLDATNPATATWSGTKPAIEIWSGSCKTIEDCAEMTEQAFNWWAAESGYACVMMYYDATNNKAGATAYATGETIPGGAAFSTYMTA
jgi:hypothetical protein